MTDHDQTTVDLARSFARGRAGARSVYLSSAFDRVCWLPRLAGRNVRNADDPDDGYSTEAEAVAAAKRYRENCRRWLQENAHG